jgi:hypothetical protein
LTSTVPRPSAVSGHFYPDDPVELAKHVDALLARVPLAQVSDRPARAYVVPHAPYWYSGATAAPVYSRLRAVASEVRRVILIGPSHYEPLRGCAVPSSQIWQTPLGDVQVDRELCLELARDGHVTIADSPHTAEHSLEVQLPFVQRALGPGVSVLPVAVGQATVDDVVVTLAAALEIAAAGTVVLCSTDLSHDLSQTAAQRQDGRTVQAVLALAPERIGVRDACGVYCLRGLVGWARHEGYTPTLLHLCTSADHAGDPSRVVGYSAFAFG